MKKTFLLLALSICLLSCNDRKPVIGISGSVYDARVSVRDEYSNAISKAGGIPVILPLCSGADEAEAMVGAVDGLIMTGGEDVNPAYYGEEALNETVSVYGRRDTSDFMLLEAALKRGIPVLGICRGSQLINIHFGGTLYQDLPTQTDTLIHHRQTTDRCIAQHQIYIEKGSELFQLLQLDSVGVNSFHHQAVKVLGNGMKISARATDGIIEGYEGHGVFCVQFHPEAFVSAGDDTFLPIFKAFVRKARRPKTRMRVQSPLQ